VDEIALLILVEIELQELELGQRIITVEQTISIRGN
jgi:hypothetical protein